MGVYIPNMSKPKFCKCDEYNCFAWDDEKYKCKITEWKKPCPLIEIDLVRCGECKYWESAKNGWNGYCENKVDAFNTFYANDFCSFGERRSDE